MPSHYSDILEKMEDEERSKMPDCNEELREAGAKMWPRTCARCGKGKCLREKVNDGSLAYAIAVVDGFLDKYNIPSPEKRSSMRVALCMEMRKAYDEGMKAASPPVSQTDILARLDKVEKTLAHLVPDKSHDV